MGVRDVRLQLKWEELCPDKPNQGGKTPFWWAAWKGNKRVMKVLCRQDDDNLNKQKPNGQTLRCCSTMYRIKEQRTT